MQDVVTARTVRTTSHPPNSSAPGTAPPRPSCKLLYASGQRGCRHAAPLPRAEADAHNNPQSQLISYPTLST